jgi:hypothetical protein
MKFQSGKKLMVAIMALGLFSFASCNDAKTEEAAPAAEPQATEAPAPAMESPAAPSTTDSGADASKPAIQGSDAPVSTTTATK